MSVIGWLIIYVSLCIVATPFQINGSGDLASQSRPVYLPQLVIIIGNRGQSALEIATSLPRSVRAVHSMALSEVIARLFILINIDALVGE